MRIRSLVTAWLVVSSFAPACLGAQETGDGEQHVERGPVSALIRLEPQKVRIGDSVTLTLEVTAEADVELLMPVFGESLERFTILEFVPKERIEKTGRSIASQSYRLQALSSGTHNIPPITIEFVDRRPGMRPAPEDEDAYELLTPRISFEVESVLPENAGDMLKPPLGPLAPLAETQTRTWPWLALIAVIFAIAGLLILWRHVAKRVQRQTALELALGRLDVLEARPRPDARAMDSFFVELSDLVRRYLEARFALHAPELTTEEFLDIAATSPDLTSEHRGFLQNFLSSADRVKFARHVPAATEVESVLSSVRDFLQQTAPDSDAPARDHPQGVAHA